MDVRTRPGRGAQSPEALLTGLARDGVGLDLKTLEVCFLAALHLRAEHFGVAAFEDEALVALFVEVCGLVEPGSENARLRATHTLQRLRDQRLLIRVDGADLARAGEFTLTRLGQAVVDFYLADEVLTVESLTRLTRALAGHLGAVGQVARQASHPDHWRQVIGDLRVTVSDLVGGIERRQRGLDLQQTRLRAEIGELLQTDWTGAIDRCQALLDATARTLAELNAVLLRDTHQLQALLQDIQAFAQEAAAVLPLPLDDAESAVESSTSHLAQLAMGAASRVMDQVDRIGAWGRARQRAWSEYFQYVHRFLRDVVRLDPDRALSRRLRDLLAGFGERPFGYVVADAPSIKLLRPQAVVVERPPVERPRGEREAEPLAVAPEDEQAELEARVRARLVPGPTTLAEVTAAVLAELGADSPDRAFLLAGRVAALVARLARTRGDHERPWRAVGHDIALEDVEVLP